MGRPNGLPFSRRRGVQHKAASKKLQSRAPKAVGLHARVSRARSISRSPFGDAGQGVVVGLLNLRCPLHEIGDIVPIPDVAPRQRIGRTRHQPE